MESQRVACVSVREARPSGVAACSPNAVQCHFHLSTKRRSAAGGLTIPGRPCAWQNVSVRIVVIGNSGSGKSTLASALASQNGLEHLDLDTLAWQPTDPPQRVSLEDATATLRDFSAAHEAWVAEGCYADLVELLLSQATEFIFLDLPVDVCQAHARARPWEPHKYASKEAQDANLDMLLGWIADYPSREGPLGRAAHEALFEGFTGRKERRVRRTSADSGL